MPLRCGIASFSRKPLSAKGLRKTVRLVAKLQRGIPATSIRPGNGTQGLVSQGLRFNSGRFDGDGEKNQRLVVDSPQVFPTAVDCSAMKSAGQRLPACSKHLVDFADMAVPGSETVTRHANNARRSELGARRLLTAAARLAMDACWTSCLPGKTPLVWIMALLFLIFARPATGQLIDSLDAYPPRWSLEQDDCDARITEHGHAADPAAEGGACETLTMLASHGTKAVLVYPIEPLRPIDELAATVQVKGLHEGVRLGFRVRFPYIVDPQTKRSAAVIVYGSSYKHVGEFQKLGVSAILRDMKLKQVALRNEYGSQADVSSPYVDAVAIDAYGGPGSSSLRIDELKVDAMVPLADDYSGGIQLGLGKPSDSNSIAALKAAEVKPPSDPHSLHSQISPLTPRQAALSLASNPAFPLGKVTRVLQYNGEPLSWVRSLGIDAVWLNHPPDASILSEAIAARMQIYAPAPSSPDPKLQPLLEPIAGWIVAGDRPMDSRNLDAIAQDIERLRKLPTRWQRRIVGSPVESFREYGASLDAVVLDAPPRVRNLSDLETKQLRHRQSVRSGSCPFAVGVSSSPDPIAIEQSDAIAGRIGTPLCESFQWHGMWRQVAAAIADRPAAIIYRSSQSLASGTPLQQNRAMALSYVNRFVAAIEPWVAGCTPDLSPMIVRDSATSQPIYVGHRFQKGPTTLIVMTSAMHRGDATLAGDGKSLSIGLPPEDQGKMVWRLTHFSAERLTPETSTRGTTLEIVSPDFVEVIAISGELAEAGRLASSTKRYARQAALDRWQLAGDAIIRSEMTWQQAVAGRVVGRSAPLDLLQVAKSSLANAEELVRGGQVDSSLRLARRADAWIAKADWMLHDGLVEGVHPGDAVAIVGDNEPSPFMPGRFISSPPLTAGNYETQIAWSPLLKTPINPNLKILPSVTNQVGTRSRWGINRIAGGDFERGNMTGRAKLSPDQVPAEAFEVFDGASVLEREGWTLGKRHSQWAHGEATWIDRGAFSGKGALRVRVTPNGEADLPGGYEGTCLMVRSPAVRMPPSSVVRIDMMVRTLGFSGPHQGLLIYDSVGTQAMGVLVGQRPEWTPVTLFRQTGDAAELYVMVEVIGGGEAILDEIQVRTWETTANPIDAMRPIDTAMLNE